MLATTVSDFWLSWNDYDVVNLLRSVATVTAPCAVCTRMRLSVTAGAPPSDRLACRVTKTVLLNRLMDEAMMDFAHRIRLSRRRSGLSQAALAARLGIQRSAVSQWEGNNAKRPRLEHLQALATVTGVSFEWLATGRGPIPIDEDQRQDGVATSTALLIEDDLEVRMLSAFRRGKERTKIALVEVMEATYR